MEEPIGYILKQLQQLLRGAMDDDLRRHGLTTPQYAALHGLARGPLSSAELARRSFVTPQTMTVIVNNLHHAGLVERRRDGADARALLVALAPAGAALLAECRREIDAIEERMAGDLDPSERHALSGMLQRCARALGGRQGGN